MKLGNRKDINFICAVSPWHNAEIPLTTLNMVVHLASFYGNEIVDKDVFIKNLSSMFYEFIKNQSERRELEFIAIRVDVYDDYHDITAFNDYIIHSEDIYHSVCPVYAVEHAIKESYRSFCNGNNFERQGKITYRF